MARTFKHRFLHEIVLFLITSALLFVFFCSLSLYRNLVVGNHSITALQYGYIGMESLILAKMLRIGKSLKLGEKFLDKPLIIPTLYKTIVFCLFLVCFAILEHFVIGLVTGKPLALLYQTFATKGLVEIMGKVPLFLTISLPIFALLETGRSMGRERLWALFFSGKESKTE